MEYIEPTEIIIIIVMDGVILVPLQMGKHTIAMNVILICVLGVSKIILINKLIQGILCNYKVFIFISLEDMLLQIEEK